MNLFFWRKAKRYQVEDPTGQGFWQVVDTSERPGKTYVVATFSKYLDGAKEQAEAMAQRLTDSERHWPTARQLQARYPGWFYSLTDTHQRGMSVVLISMRCPNAAEEMTIIWRSLNRGAAEPERFKVTTLEDYE